MSQAEHYMRRAFELALQGQGKVAPNPMVGAVIVKEGKVVSEGFHRSFGEAHAELDAIRKAAGVDLTGASIYVNLEPCSHYGKTPPCTEAIKNAGIKQVYFSVSDPNQEAAGGAQILKEWGISCEGGILKEEGEEINRFFLHAFQKKRPYISLKLALTLNGNLAREDGSSKWISCDQARTQVHLMRAQHQAIFTGVQTILEDDPALTTRMVTGLDPLRIIWDARNRVPASNRVFSDENYLLFNQDNIPESILKSDRAEQWDWMLEKLFERSVHSLMVEGGSQVASFLLEQKLPQRLHFYYGPKVFNSQAPSGIKIPVEQELHTLSIHRHGKSMEWVGTFEEEHE